ncbi:unnamed protein product [Symbiodinium sp. CCMP2592]|nr:unnamed protein product [Symbiodinium sp. CCMP2592]
MHVPRLMILRAAAVRLPPGEGHALLSNASAPFAIMEDWFLGESDDPLAVPFALFLERFAVPGEDDDPEMFEDEDRRFKLSHIAPVDPPMETAASLDSAFLTRSEIGIARDVLDICLQECNFSLDHAQAEKAIGKSIEPFLLRMIDESWDAFVAALVMVFGLAAGHGQDDYHCIAISCSSGGISYTSASLAACSGPYQDPLFQTPLDIQV